MKSDWAEWNCLFILTNFAQRQKFVKIKDTVHGKGTRREIIREVFYDTI
jgi:hypothetical protein